MIFQIKYKNDTATLQLLFRCCNIAVHLRKKWFTSSFQNCCSQTVQQAVKDLNQKEHSHNKLLPFQYCDKTPHFSKSYKRKLMKTGASGIITVFSSAQHIFLPILLFACFSPYPYRSVLEKFQVTAHLKKIDFRQNVKTIKEDNSVSIDTTSFSNFEHKVL